MGYQRFRPERGGPRKVELNVPPQSRSVADVASVAGHTDSAGAWRRWRGTAANTPSQPLTQRGLAGGIPPATLATVATLPAPGLRTVASVATVAGLTAVPTIVAAYGRLIAKEERRPKGNSQDVVEQFLREFWSTAREFGWTDIELFGCHPNPDFACVRYDCMGAVTVAALTATPIVLVSSTEIRGRNGLSSRRPLTSVLAQPVWITFAEDETR